MPRLFTLACLFAALLPGGVVTAAEQSARIVELETPLASAQPLQAYLRQPDGSGPLPAIVLLHGCAGNWKRLDERWGGRLAAWGYVTLAVDSFGPRGIDNTCAGGAPIDMAFDAYRALDYLAGQSFVDSNRVAVLGFSQGGWLTLTSLERGAEGRDGFGISREKGVGVPMKLIVYPGAYHAFDVPTLQNQRIYFGHHLEYNQAATEQSIEAVHDFFAGMIGSKDDRGSKPDR